jgi:peroxiredoxin
MAPRMAAITALCSAFAFAQTLRVGSPVSDFTVNDLSGKPATFAELRGPATVVIFISVQCPISNAFNERMNEVYRDYSSKGVKFIFINSNFNESPAEVQSHAKQVGFAFPVYKDPGNVVADRFGAMSTPEAYIIDSAGVLQYHGYIEDNTNAARVKNRGLREALDAVLAGKQVPRPETKAFGCTIKRARRNS